MIATLFGKKRITEEKLANAFVNAVLRLTEQGYPMIVAELQDSPEFTEIPVFGPGDDELFALIVLAGNLLDAPKHLPAGQDRRFFSLAVSKFANAMGTTASELELEVIALQHYMERINHPSKNTVYAMSKVVFHKFDLFRFQDQYFRDMKAPNPIVLKRLNQLMAFCLWDWAELLDEFKVTQ
ncbi:MAG: hypothetical protein QM724_12025 [Flavobacteriales bacterium]